MLCADECGTRGKVERNGKKKGIMFFVMQVKMSKKGLLSTVAYQGQDEKPVYALEGSVGAAVSGGAVEQSVLKR